MCSKYLYLFCSLFKYVCPGGGQLEGGVIGDELRGQGEVGDELRTYNFIKPK